MTDRDAAADAPWIATRGLGFAYGTRTVLDDLTLNFHPGRHYIIAGPNGAGKSTLLDLLANLKRRATGALTVMGRPMEKYEPGELARTTALAPQEFRLDFDFTVREVVAMGRRPFLGRWGGLSGEDRRIVDDALAALRLEALAERPVTALSGGERRRCVVARALAQTTPVILLDEPGAGLDIAQALSLMSVAKGLAEQGKLVVTVSHDLNLAAMFGHEIVFLQEGRLAASGPVAEVFTGGNLSRIYGTPSEVRRDDFSGALSVSFRNPEAAGRAALSQK